MRGLDLPSVSLLDITAYLTVMSLHPQTIGVMESRFFYCTALNSGCQHMDLINRIYGDQTELFLPRDVS